MPADNTSTRHAETRRLAAIMFTDIVGFSRQMGADEVHMLRLLDIHNQIIQQVVAEHHGHLIKSIGDGFLVEFPSVVNAVRCAQQIQSQFHAYNLDKKAAEQIHVRIGIHLGDIVEHEGDVQGDGVNIAARLEALAEGGGICIPGPATRRTRRSGCQLLPFSCHFSSNCVMPLQSAPAPFRRKVSVRLRRSMAGPS